MLLLEATALFSSTAGFSSSESKAEDVSASLLFIDDLLPRKSELEALAADKRLKVRLMDHNNPWGPFFGSPSLSSAIDSIVDHHRDAGKLLSAVPAGSAEREISFDESEGRGVGSTCTLVAQHLKRSIAAAASASAAAEPGAGRPLRLPLHKEIAYCLLGVIMLDTIGLSEAAGKTTPLDVEMVDFLSNEVLEGEHFATAESRQALFARLSSLRMDPAWWLSLALPQALKYDYKCFSYPTAKPDSSSAASAAVRVGVSAITLHVSDFLAGSSSETAETASAITVGSAGGVPFPFPATPLHLCPERLASLRAFLTGDCKGPDGDSENSTGGLAGEADVFLVMSFCAGRRQFAVWRRPVAATGSPAPLFGDANIARLIALLSGDSLLQPFEIPVVGEGSSDIVVFEQRNTKASRKQVEPLLSRLIPEAASIDSAL